MVADDQSDETLFAAYRDGDMAAFDALYARYRQPLYLFLLRRGHGDAAADDIFHDCWLKIIDQRVSFDGNSFRAWVFTITRNLSTDAFRRGSLRVAENLEENEDVGAHGSAQQAQEALDCVELMKSGSLHCRWNSATCSCSRKRRV